MKPIRHFLSHQHDDRPHVTVLETDMRRRGLLSWRDRKDQNLGAATDPAVERAIRHETDGFVLYGSPRLVDSWYVWNREWPHAYMRHQAERDAGHGMPYPLIPLMVGTEIEHLKAAAVKHNTTTPNPFNGDRLDESSAASRRAASHRLLRAALARRSVDTTMPLQITLTTFGVPDGHEGDVVVDWTDDFRGTSVPWEELLASRDDLKEELARVGRPLELRIQARLTPAFAFGHAFPRPARLPMVVGPDRWAVGRADNPALVTCKEEPRAGSTSVAGVFVSLARNVAAAGDLALSEHRLDVGTVGYLTFAPGVTAVDSDVAAAAAYSFGSLLRGLRDRGVTEAHLFMAAPAELAALLGSAINAGPAITLYHTEDGRYIPSVRVV